MKIGFVADAHGNTSGLRACLGYLNARIRVDAVYFLGDAVGYLPDGPGVLEILENERISCLLGNHEAMLLGQLEVEPGNEDIYRLGETRAQLHEHRLSRIRALRPSREVRFGRRTALLAHGSPQDPLRGYIYPDSPLGDLETAPYDLIVMGHTHRPFMKRCGDKIILNAGSAGLPRDQGNLLSCAIYDADAHQAEIVRLPFDEEALLARLGDSVHPAVAECFRRKAGANIQGKVIHDFHVE